MKQKTLHVLLLFFLLLAGCGPAAGAPSPAVSGAAFTLLPYTPTSPPSATVTARPTLTSLPSITPTRTPTATPTLIPTATLTPTPVMAGTPLPPVTTPIIEDTLNQVSLLAQWGRGRITGLAWSADGSQLAAATPLGVYLYKDPSLAAPLHLDTRAPAFRLAFSLDGAWLAVDTANPGSGADLALPAHRIQLWDLTAPDPYPLPALETGGAALDLAFSPAGQLLVLTRLEGGALLQRWDVTTRQRQQAVNLLGGEAAVEGVFSRDLTQAATHGQAGPVRFWSLADGINLATTPEGGGSAGPMAFSPDGALLAVGYPDKTQDFVNTNQVKVWRVPQQPGARSELAFSVSDAIGIEGAAEAILSVAWSPNGDYLAASDAAQQIHVWPVKPAGPIYRRINAANLPLFLAFAPSPSPGVLRLAGGGLEIWLIETGKPGAITIPAAYDDGYLPGLNDMRFTPDGAWLALAEFGRIDFRSVLDGSHGLTVADMTGPVNSLSFSPQGNYFVAACQDGTTRLYRTRDGRYLDQLGEPTSPVLAAAFAPNNFWIASSGEDMRIRIFRLDDGVQIKEISQPYVAYQLAFAPNSDQLACHDHQRG